jgi:hypothetical protein
VLRRTRDGSVASETIVETTVITSASSAIAPMNERSIFSACTGSRAR